MKELKIIRYFLRTAWRIGPGYVFAVAANAVLLAALPFIGVFLPKLIIDELLGARRIALLAIYAGGAVSVTLILHLIRARLERYIASSSIMVEDSIVRQASAVMLGCDYAKLEDPAFIDLKERALFIGTDRSIQEIVQALPDILGGFLSMAGTVIILLRFDWIVIAAVLVLTLLNFPIQRWFQKEQIVKAKARSNLNKDFNYYIRFFRNRSLNKDARLHEAADYLIGKTEANDKLLYSLAKEEAHYIHLNEGVSTTASILQTALVYGYVGVRTLLLGLGVGDFTMFTGAAATFDAALRKFFGAILNLRRNAVLLTDLIALNETPLQEQDKGQAALPNRYDIVFENVSFRYPGSDSFVLRNVSFTIPQNKRAAIVGRNGAGKTTLVKLLCRLYAPDEGRILVGGVDIAGLPYTEYCKLLAVVFQDFKLFEFSVLENIAPGAQTPDETAVWAALGQAGIGTDIAALPNGLQTMAGKWYEEDGVEFSGGQQQKLAIARAIYRDAPLIVLDEPTAALDPLAEADIYERFNEAIIRDKTAIYISHRLSSCKFCDLVLYIEGAGIGEQGSHDELMAQNGQYATMFRLQQEQFH
ncbi:MAG: ABC transporter ATP-binding protein/permease [Clostridiales bacterium]|nr:ABC transporter ATP-binding protein/permease [Clostridiales bacterium]